VGLSERVDIGGGFAEGRVVAGGFEVRYGEAGDGPPLVCLHGAGGLTLTRSHELLAERYRVIAFETPGFGESPVNDRSASLADLAATMRDAVAALGLDRCSVWGTSFGGKLALWLAVQDPDRLDALVLAAPAAIRLRTGSLPPAEELPALLYAHPERVPVARLSPEVDAKQRKLVGRLIGPPRDAELETEMRRLEVPTLVLFGTLDRITPPELGRHYRELLPRCHFVIVYDAAHAIAADRPEAFAAVVGDFLERREEFIVRRESGLLYR
jgi:pimeloyl-ACP methyl ester carboxylesterase